MRKLGPVSITKQAKKQLASMTMMNKTSRAAFVMKYFERKY